MLVCYYRESTENTDWGWTVVDNDYELQYSSIANCVHISTVYWMNNTKIETTTLTVQMLQPELIAEVQWNMYV